MGILELIPVKNLGRYLISSKRSMPLADNMIKSVPWPVQGARDALMR